MRRLLLLLFLVLPWPAQGVRLVVTVTDSLSGEAVDEVEVRVAPAGRAGRGAPSITSFTDRQGITRLSLPAGGWTLRLRHGAFAGVQRQVTLRDAQAPGHRDTLRVRLRRVVYLMPERLATAVAAPSPAGVTMLAPVEAQRLPAPTADPLRLLRVLPGVASGGDQAPSTYFVRGGGYDENLLYIEGIEIEAPLLLRNGLAETFSLANDDMVASLQFHAGVLPARFGDRLSSALQIGYRRPDSLQISARASLTQQAATLGARVGRLQWLLGVRQADLQRLTRGLQTRGAIAPAYGDGQALVVWRGEGAAAQLFAARARSRFGLEPSMRRLRSNCVDPRVAPLPGRSRGAGCEEFIGVATGAEVFDYDVDVIGSRVTLPAGRWRLHAQGAAVRRQEREDTDQVFAADWVPSSSRQAAVTNWLAQHQVATGRLDQRRVEASLALAPAAGEAWQVGAGVRRTRIQGQRSAADTVWLEGRVLAPERLDEGIDRTPLDRFGWVHSTWDAAGWKAQLQARLLHAGESDEWLLLPRLRLGRQSGSWRLTTAAGMAAQPALYKELLAAGAGTPRAQKGADAFIEAERQSSRWRLRTTAFLRRGWDRISWTVEDAAVRYAAGNDSRTRAWGTEVMLRGQVGRAVGMVSYSWLQAQEDLDADGRGWLPAASDQRHTATAYLEDQMDLRVRWMRASRFHLRLLYGSGFPFTARVAVRDDDGRIVRFVEGDRHARRADPYIRFDVGMTQAFQVNGWEVELRQEVANLFDEFNAVGYRQLPAPDGTMALLPRGLGRRFYDAEIAVRF